MLKVSVIVPVYNAEKHIDKCINSLINQSYGNLEIILVNDGSSDNSLNKLKNYMNNDNRIKVFNQKNKGAGSARNTGLKKSSGDFVTFLDADDCFAVDAIKNMLSVAEENTDIIIGGIRIYSTNMQIICKSIPSQNVWSEFKYTATAFKLYKRKFLVKNNILYNSYFCNEDLMFCLTAYSKTKNIKVCSTDDYYNYKNIESVTYSMKQNKKIFNVLPVIKNIYDNIDLSKYKNDSIQFFDIKTVVQNILMQLDNGNSSIINKMYLENYCWIEQKKIASKKIKLHWQKGETFSINLIVNMFIIVKKIKLSHYLIRLLKKFKVWRKV